MIVYNRRASYVIITLRQLATIYSIPSSPLSAKHNMSAPPKVDPQPPPYSPYAIPGAEYPAQQQAYPPGYGPYVPPAQLPPGAAQQGYGTTIVTVPAQPEVVIVGGCPNCRVGMLRDDYGCCAIFLAIFFFPIGILCCLAMRERRCTNCNASF